MSMMLARYLKDFSAPEPVPAHAGSEPDFPAFSLDDDFPSSSDFLGLPEPELDIEAEKQAAFDDGYAKAKAELEARFEEEREALVTQQTDALEKLKTAHEERLAHIVGEALPSITQALAQNIAGQAAEAILPLIEANLLDKTMADLADMIKTALQEGSIATITVQGSSSLFDHLLRHMPEGQEMLRHVPSDDFDLSIDMDGQTLVTRIAVWSDNLKKVLE